MDFDHTKSEAFSEQLVETLNGAAIALMISIGHQAGLFDAMTDLPPSTSAQVATAAGLNERYVREWLAAMTTGGVVDYGSVDGTFTLPPEHGAWLTRTAGVDNIAVAMMIIPLLGNVEQQIIDCFHNGGGVPYAEYTCFQHVMAENSNAGYRDSLVDTVLPLAPGVVDRLRAGIDVVDIGCGSGHAINVMAQTFLNSRFVGYDFSEEGIAAGRAEADEMGLANAHFEVKDVSMLDISDRFDFITAFDSIHDQARPARVLDGIATALRPAGTFLMVDIMASSNLGENLDHPFGSFTYTVSCLHCMTVSLALDGAGLGAMWGKEKAQHMLAAAGFDRIEVKEIKSDIFNYYYVATRS